MLDGVSGTGGVCGEGIYGVSGGGDIDGGAYGTCDEGGGEDVDCVPVGCVGAV